MDATNSWHVKELTVHFFRLTKDWALAEDLRQHAILKALESKRPNVNNVPFLFTIGRNHYLTLRKHEAKKNGNFVDFAAIPARSETPDIESRETLDELKHAIEGLPKKNARDHAPPPKG